MKKPALVFAAVLAFLTALPLAVAAFVIAVRAPAASDALLSLACTQSVPAVGVSSRAVAGVRPDVEGGIGFPLPNAGQPRLNSLGNPALPIPRHIKTLYIAAGNQYKIPWTLLAGIGMEETAHGRNTGTSSAGAQGLMQFMRATFTTMGVDGDGDGKIHIGNDPDSIFSAANYLTRSGVTNGPEGVRKAIFAYNHADWYVNDVLFYAHAYGGGLVLGDPADCGDGGGAGNPSLPPLTSERVSTLLTWANGQVGKPYVFGANGPDAWDCSSFTRAAFAQIGISLPRTAQAQRDWLAHGNGFRVAPGQERPGDLIFWDSYLGPARIGHVMIVWDPATKTTIEAHGRKLGVGKFTYATGPEHKTYETWRSASVGRESR